MTRAASLEKVEMDLLLEGLFRHYGYDFRHYSHASLKRRLDHVRGEAKLARYTQLLDLLLHDEDAFDIFLKSMSITVTEMFRDPNLFKVLREKVVPVLKTFPYVKIWHAGCATGEEVYSMAILLHEEDFLSRARIYATDFNKHSLDKGQKGVYALEQMETFAVNYRAGGGRRDFSDYFGTRYEFAKFKDYLQERITFSYHNLVTDGVFGEMNLILCRNVLIYFNKTLQDQVLALFTQSLRHGGFLCLGNKETLNYTAVRSYYEPVDAHQKIYRRCGAHYD